MKKWEDYQVNELKEIKNSLLQYNTLEDALIQLERTISEKEENQNLNIRLNVDLMVKCRMLDNLELRVVRENHIHNLQELIDCDLDSLVGITSPIKKELEWKRHFYDMNRPKK